MSSFFSNLHDAARPRTIMLTTSCSQMVGGYFPLHNQFCTDTRNNCNNVASTLNSDAAAYLIVIIPWLLLCDYHAMH